MSAAKRWSSVTLDKARAYQLATELTKLCSHYYPFLLPQLQHVLERLQPLRLSQCGRQLRAWGRDYSFSPEEIYFIRHLVEQYRFGTKVVPLPAESFAEHPILHDGILCTDGEGMFWLEEPDDEKQKPALVIFPTRKQKERPGERISKEAMALAALADHPDWSDEQIAHLAGCSRSSLYRMPRYMMARQMLTGSRSRLSLHME
jgi:hypothetical protein